MGSFPMPDMTAEDMPIEEIVRFWTLHGIVGVRPADRHTVVGGMYRYIEKLGESLLQSGADIRFNTRVHAVSRGKEGVSISTVDTHHQTNVVHADQVIFALHPRTVLPLIADDAEPEEVFALASFKIQRARCVVHHDADLMAKNREDWGAFNYVAQEGDWPAVRPTITFYPNRLGHLPPSVPDTFVTMNPYHEPRPGTVVSDNYLVHPVGVGGEKGKNAIKAMQLLQGKRHTWWAGGYISPPSVHESAWVSGRVVAEQLLQEFLKVGEEATVDEDCHEITVTFEEENQTGRSKNGKPIDVTFRLRAPRHLAVKSIRIH